MNTLQPDTEVVAAAVTKTLYDQYGGTDVFAIVMWCPPGSAQMELYSNDDPPGVVKALRLALQAAKLSQRKSGSLMNRLKACFIFLLWSAYLGGNHAWATQVDQWNAMEAYCYKQGYLGAWKGPLVDGDAPKWRRYVYVFGEPTVCMDHQFKPVQT